MPPGCWRVAVREQERRGQETGSAGAIAGLAALVPDGIAASPTGVCGPGLNSAIHISGSSAVLLIMLSMLEAVVPPQAWQAQRAVLAVTAIGLG